jgi:hypothetical protein
VEQPLLLTGRHDERVQLMDGTNYSGGCLCGRVRYQASGDGSNRCFCHCTSCRRAIGAPMVPWVTFAARNFTIVQGQLAQYRSSPGVRRGFCAACGTSMTYSRDDRGDEIDVTVSSLDDPATLVPEAHIWVEDKLPWVDIADGRAQFARSLSCDPKPGTSAS